MSPYGLTVVSSPPLAALTGGRRGPFVVPGQSRPRIVHDRPCVDIRRHHSAIGRTVPRMAARDEHPTDCPGRLRLKDNPDPSYADPTSTLAWFCTVDRGHVYEDEDSVVEDTSTTFNDL